MGLVGEFEKISSESETQTIDFSDRLPSSVTVSSATAAAVDLIDGSTPSVTASVTNNSTSVSFVAQSGTDGHDYLITVSATLSNSNVIKEQVLMRVRDRSL